MIVKSPDVSSMRSRQTGQVGNSISAGVGGAKGFVESAAEDTGGREGETAPASAAVMAEGDCGSMT